MIDSINQPTDRPTELTHSTTNDQRTPTAHLKQLGQQINVPAPALFVAAASLFAVVVVLVLSLEGVALLLGFLYPLRE